MAQCALQLPSHQGHVEMSHPFALLLYVGTFAIIASLWLIFHRLMSGAYRPAGVDLFLAFAYLAAVSLFPFSLYDVTHTRQTLDVARVSVAQYSALYAGMIAIAAALNMRNLRRGYFVQDESDRDRTWRNFLRNCTLATTMLVALAVDLTIGPASTGFVFPLLIVLIPLVRRIFPSAPRARALGLAESEDGTTQVAE